MNKWFVILFLSVQFLNAQVPVLSLKNDTLFYVTIESVLNKKQETLYSFKGNIVFKGNSNNYKDIVYTMAFDSLNQNDAGIIYDGKGKPSNIMVKQNTIYYKINGQDIPIMALQKNEDSWAFYNKANDSLIAYIPFTNLSKSILFTSFITLWDNLAYKDKILNQLKAQSPTPNELSVMLPIFGNGMVWVWDGTYLYPDGANLNNSLVWIYKDNKLSPRNYPRTQEEWKWDGDGLKPYWGGNPQYLWTWQGGILRQTWVNNYQNEYIIDENIVRKRFGNYGDNEWELIGNMPLPLITAIILGYVYR
ncbi:MAG: hypothetical protein LRY27_03295 [Chitinophagales bacterium]|nr:hypothetical protein [Chitinophagales bacterium]